MEIQQVTRLRPQIAALEQEAVQEGFMFINRLTSEWHLGTNRFDAPGECLMAAYLDRRLGAIRGLSVDPFMQALTGRLRRVYLAPALRGATDWKATDQRLACSRRFEL